MKIEKEDYSAWLETEKAYYTAHISKYGKGWPYSWYLLPTIILYTDGCFVIGWLCFSFRRDVKE